MNGKVVCICGSMRHYPDMLAAARKLTLAGYIVLMPFVLKAPREDEIVQLDMLHKEKIDMADWVYVCNIDNYIGASTSNEIEYCKRIGKSVEYQEESLIGT